MLLRAILAVFAALSSQTAQAACRLVDDVPAVEISSENSTALKKIQFDRALVFETLKRTSIPETSGCWAGSTGNFDEQIVSVGVLQWNYGQGSLQPMLRTFRARFLDSASFNSEIELLMPQYGKLLFSAGCLQQPITKECHQIILSKQSPSGKLEDSFKSELDALFNSDTMIQLQVDAFNRLLTSVRSDLQRMFGEKITPLHAKWAIDIRIQQGRFPSDNTIARMRKAALQLSPEKKRIELISLINWYKGLCGALDQDGVRLDCDYNVNLWTKEINSGFSDHQFDLINLTFIRSRTSTGQEGRWQALTFQRRVLIIFGVGSIAGHRYEKAPI